MDSMMIIFKVLHLSHILQNGKSYIDTKSSSLYVALFVGLK